MDAISKSAQRINCYGGLKVGGLIVGGLNVVTRVDLKSLDLTTV